MSEFSLARSCLITCVSSWISEVGSPKRLLPLATGEDKGKGEEVEEWRREGG